MTTAFETIREKKTFVEEVVAVGVTVVIAVAEVAAMLDELQVGVAEGRPKGNHLDR